MITSIERAARAHMETALADDSSLAAISWVVREATTKAEPPGDRHMVVCRVAEAPRVVGGLWDGHLELVLVTPAGQGEMTAANHGAMELAIAAAWTGATAAWVTAVAAELTGWHAAGVYPEGWTPGRENTSWLPVFRVHVGIAENGL